MVAMCVCNHHILCVKTCFECAEIESRYSEADHMLMEMSEELWNCVALKPPSTSALSVHLVHSTPALPHLLYVVDVSVCYLFRLLIHRSLPKSSRTSSQVEDEATRRAKSGYKKKSVWNSIRGKNANSRSTSAEQVGCLLLT